MKTEKLKRDRILTTVDSANARYRDINSALTCVAKTAEGIKEWQVKFYAALKNLLGRMPEPVPLRPEIVERKVFPTYIREKLIFDSEKYMSVPAYVCSPVTRKRGQRFPAILCCPGHGIGKNPLVGLDLKGKVYKEYHKMIAVRLAEHGFVTITLDWRAFGERTERPEQKGYPHDPCNLTALVMHRLGFVLQGLHLWDAMKCIDYLQARNDVIAEKIGCIGLSLGGTMTTLIAAMDNRVGAACINGGLSIPPASARFGAESSEGAQDRIGSIVECGSQLIPGLVYFGEDVDIGALICPRALLIQAGRYDSCSVSSMQINAYNYLEKIYKIAGAEHKIELDLFDGVHEINVPYAVDFFTRRLK